MASVTSLDKDLRKLRLEKYTPAAANEARLWIEEILGERLSSGDLLEGLKDGVALCKLVNLACRSRVAKFKQSAMPFVQMENVSHFLRACQSPPLNLQEHDMFLTVDLYEQKDPAQVLQCLGAFSRAAQKANPTDIPSCIGPKTKTAAGLSPQSTGQSQGRAWGAAVAPYTSSSSSPLRGRPGLSSTKTGDSGSGRWSPTRNANANANGPSMSSPNLKSPTSPSSDRLGSPRPVSSWSKRDHEGVTNPAWNIAQYGYMGGASQGSMGIAFGGRRQITSAGPYVPSLNEKERLRKEKEAEEERQRLQMEEEVHRRKSEAEADEQNARLEEQHRWEDETRRTRVEEKRRAEEERRKWEEEERMWKITEEKRRQDEEEAEARLDEERKRSRSKSRSRIQGQFLSQHQAEQDSTVADKTGDYHENRVKELERALELARQREQEYEEERQRRTRKTTEAKNRSRSRPRLMSRPPSRQDSYVRGEKEVLRTSWNRQDAGSHLQPPDVVPVTSTPSPALPVRPLPEPKPSTTPPRVPSKPKFIHENRPLPLPQRVRSSGASDIPATPSPSTSATTSPVITSRPLPEPKRPENSLPSTSSTPASPPLQPTYSREVGGTSEKDAEDRRRVVSQTKTKAGGVASKSLLEREMEMERERQREWEENQKETAKAVRTSDGVEGIGGGIGGRWDVSQWSGYAGGDSQNNGTAGIGAGRRQIVGPRPLPSHRP